MENVHPITPDRYLDKSYKKYSDMKFAAKDMICPVIMQELPRIACMMPVGFVEFADSGIIPVGLLGISDGENLFVDKEGKWNAPYIPANYRAYPFRLGNATDGNQLVCFDEDAGLLLQDKSGIPFFKDEENLSDEMKEGMEFMTEISRGVATIQAHTQQLIALDLLKDWDMQVPTAQGPRQVGGLKCIDEAKLNELTDEQFLELRKTGALMVALAQLMSMHQVGALGMKYSLSLSV